MYAESCHYHYTVESAGIAFESNPSTATSNPPLSSPSQFPFRRFQAFVVQNAFLFLIYPVTWTRGYIMGVWTQQKRPIEPPHLERENGSEFFCTSARY